MDDPGYFGPASVTWRVHAEPLTMVGGLRALLLQALHPEAMAVMSASSRFRQQPWARLHRTAQYVATVTFGTTADVERATARVRAVHARLGITDGERLAWVHACEVDSFLAAAQRIGVSLSRADADNYVAEQARIGPLVGVPEELTPHTTADLAAYFEQMRPRLRLTRHAVEAARYVLAPPLPVPARFAVPARLGWTTISSLAVGLLPDWAQRMYRLPALPGSQLATTASLRTLRVAIRALPADWREGPTYRAAKARLRLAS
jgi:uncharacterized protein (DUF2236 family)